MSLERPRVGIDISAKTLTVAVTYDLDKRGDPIPPYHIDLDGLWWQRLPCMPRGIVVCEPTGWHYSAPVVKLLHDHSCEVYYADHYAANDVRRLVLHSAQHRCERADRRRASRRSRSACNRLATAHARQRL